MSSAGFDRVPDKLVADSVAVRCVIGTEMPDVCDGWCGGFEIDPSDVKVDGHGRVYFPDHVPTECPECGDRVLAFNGVEVNFHA